MDISDEHHAGTPEGSPQPPPAAAPERHTDWMSYAVALIQQAAPTAADFIQAEG